MLPLILAAPESPLEASPFSIALWTVVCFLALFFVLWKTAWPRLLQALERRERAIQEALAAAEKKRAEAEELLAAGRKALEEARTEARKIHDEERARAEKVRQELLGKYRQEAEGLLAKARREITFEREQALAALRREAVELGLLAATKVLERAVTEDDHRRLAEEAVEVLGGLKA